MIKYTSTEVLIDRKEELKLVKTALDAITRGEASQATVLEFYGLAGIGKTVLLQENKRQCQQADIPFAWADLASMGIMEEGAPARLVDHIMRQLEVQGFTLPIALSVAQDAFWRGCAEDFGDNKTHKLQTLTREFVCYLKSILIRPQPLTLILDTTDACSEDFLMWLSRDVLGPLAGYGGLLVIFAGRACIEGWDSEIGRMRQKYPLRPFTVEETEAHLQHLPKGAKYAPAAPEVQKLTHGHPYSNEAVVSGLNELGVATAQVAESRMELARHLREAVIEKYIMGELESWLRSLLEVVGIPRRFDGYALKTLISQFLPELDGSRPMQYYIARIADLVGTKLVSYEEGYRVDKLLRRMQGTYLAILEPERFMALHESMAKWYKEQLQAKPGPEVKLMAERVYHLAQTLWVRREQGESIDMIEELSRAVQQDLAEHFVRSDEIDEIKTMELVDALQKDEELKMILLSPGLRGLVAIVEQFVHKPVTFEKVYLTITKEAGRQLEISLALPDQPVVPAELVNVETWPELKEVREDLNGIGLLMYGLYLPDMIQQRLRAVRSAVQIITNHADVPWELMHDGQDFLCLRVPVGRMPKMVRASRRNPYERKGKLRFLLIGDPTNDLPAARAEVEQIADLLGDVIAPTILIGNAATSLRFLKQMATKEYDVIHYAGHAYFDRHQPRNSGLVLANEKKVLAQEIERVLRGRPLVFLNACEAGRGESEMRFIGSYTEGMAISFLLGGALGCIGPLWKVPDQSAAELAIAFYRHLIEGEPIGEALRKARLKRKVANPAEDLWAAWVLYGDPTYKLLEQKEGFNQ